MIERDHKLVHYIDQVTQATGAPPTYQQMCGYMGAANRGVIHRMIRRLVDRGFLTTVPKQKQAVRVIQQAPDVDAARRMIEAAPMLLQSCSDLQALIQRLCSSRRIAIGEHDQGLLDMAQHAMARAGPADVQEAT